MSVKHKFPENSVHSYKINTSIGGVSAWQIIQEEFWSSKLFESLLHIILKSKAWY